MVILSIETSCDESAISIIEAKGGFKEPSFKILANNVASQINIHRQYGGVFPMMAKREHSKNLIPLLKKTLEESDFLKSKCKNQNVKFQSKIKKISKILEREPELLEQFLKFIPTIQKPKIDAIAVTYGPGLEPALWVGLNFAKALSLVWSASQRIPIIPVNHMEGHILSSLLTGKKVISNIQYPISKQIQKPKFQISKKIPKPKFQKLKQIKFPAIALLISGGHTELVLIKKWMDPVRSHGRVLCPASYGMNYKIIGETRDDAVGEAFDKVARMLGLPYPGGPQISALAEISRMNTDQKRINTDNKRRSDKNQGKSVVTLPRPMIYSSNFDFSFSGLKTAVLYLVQKLGKLTYGMKVAIAKEFQDAVIDVLVMKTMKAVKKYKIKTILVGGGVSANEQIRKTITREAKKENINIYFPEKELSVDNSIMIAMAGYFRYLSKCKPSNIRTLKACGNLRLK